MNMPMSLVYSGQEGQIFSGIQLGSSSDHKCINFSLDVPSVKVVVPLSSFQGKGPPQRVWADVLMFIWRGMTHNKTQLFVPLGSFASSFLGNPDTPTQAALGPILTTLLVNCRKSGDGADWRRMLTKGGSAINPEILTSNLRTATSRRIKNSEKRKQHASDRIEIKRQKRRRVLLAHSIPSYLLATIIAANWDKFKEIRRRQEFLLSLAPLIDEVCPTLGNMVDEIDPDNPGNAIYQFLSKHGFHNFQKGALSADEREASGLNIISKGKLRQKKNKI